MTEQLKQKLNDSAVLRWSVLALVAFTMLCGYFLTDVMSPLKPMLEKELLWDSLDYGFFTSAYGWFNVFLLMLIFGGIILDKMGVRFTGMGACLLMVFGCGLKYYAITTTFPEGAMLFGFKMQVTLAALGYAIFGVGVEIAGITVSKIIVKWFKGKEMALAMGLEMATARIGTTLAMVLTVPLADFFGSTDESGVFHTNIPAPILFCLVMLCVGTIAFFIYTFYDKKLDASLDAEGLEPEEPFRMKDIVYIITNKGFWLIALLCVLFYSAVFPFIKYAADLMVQKYNVDPKLAGTIPGLLPIGAIILTPLFGSLYDRIGKGATLMVIGVGDADFRTHDVRSSYSEYMVVCNGDHDYSGICFLIGSFGNVAFGSEDYSGETVGNGLCVDLLGTELGIDGRAFADRMGVELLLQRSGCRWCTDL